MPENNFAAEITELGQRWAQAELKGDSASLDGILTDDFMGVGPRGFILNKEQWVGRYAPGGLKNLSFSWEDVSIRGYGDAAVAIGIQDGEAEYNGQPASGRFRVTQILVQRDGGWLIAGIHISGPLMSGPPGA